MKIINIIIHHSGGTDAYPMQDSSGYTLKMCESDHKMRFPNMRSSLGYYCGYHYFIDRAGIVTQTRKDYEEGAHCVGYNNHPGDPAEKASIGIHLSGNFDATLPTPAQVTSLTKLLKSKVQEYGIDPKNIVPHRAHASKTCYGKRLAESWGRSLVATVTPAAELTSAKLGDSGENVKRIQDILIKGKFAVSPMNYGIYDTFMAQAVLLFQMLNDVEAVADVAFLRGEKIGPSTLKSLNKYK